ncbi:discoidin domain-containing protein [Kutzneria sp. CA-103260]|uniref:discoidin domain-containing protein n=1 Tax=Kutzneria sp. CA-103260 TaxID=2802641 RepID=UPI001BA44D3D|nr:discoidin domain-containing protein [Kutzneria sp. CA-103260]QUQ62991.1 F5/8 type C domain protein [Kutzneria sp. CA-103260]
MTISRRTFLGSTAAVTALAALPLSTSQAGAASPAGDVVGKITVGYQGWYACIGDGAPINTWWHWSQDASQTPSPTNNNNIKAWPDMREFSKGYQTAYSNLGNGQPATLFSQYDAQTVDTHFAWMSQYGCDTAALQRFNPNGSEGPTRDAVTAKVRTSAEAHGVKFYIMYDATGWTNMQSEMKADWTAKMSAYTASPMYARQNGKPVVGIWGFGFNDNNHTWDAATCLDVINWFKGQGCYVMGGVPREWRVGGAGTRTGFIDTYHAFNMISPWMVGAIGNIGDSDNIYNTINVGDQADCNSHGIDYQPCVLPGDVSGRQRAHGDFMWHQFYNMVRVGAQGIYISMFDEFTEGNQIAKSAESSATTPTNSGMLALDEDGTPCSSDYYLRLTGDGGRMLKGQIALTATRPTPPMVGGGDTQAPSVPSGLHATAHTATSATLAWTAATDNVGVTGYRIFANGSQVGTTASTSFTANGLTPSTTYSFTVTAQDAAGNSSPASAAASVTTDAGGSTNLALNRPTAESSHTQVYASGNAVDGNSGTYWESANNAFPQWLQVDLGASTPVSRIVLALPPLSAWGARTQTLTVAGSTDGSTFSTLVGSAGYTFDSNTGNTVTIPVPAGSRRYLRLTFTANTGWPAGQVSEFQVYA